MKKLICAVARWWPSALTTCAVLWITLAEHPAPEVDMPVIPNMDKVVHAIMMGGLTGAVIFDRMRAVRHAPSRTWLAWLAVGVTAFSAADEVAQSLLTATRTADALDLAADVAGILAALTIAPRVCARVLQINSCKLR